ncbi:MAG TPA: PP2C family protein-serine/threonine phosphatase [Tepidisphaeraceae bacterium]|nr:PP2C family protein-serine/threonine phosphatase [Tepidisphaeraceae bacterium]
MASDSQTAHFSRELEAIAKIQRLLLPPVPADTEAISFAVRYLPSAVAGGDYYGIRKTRQDHFALVIADVAGHGAVAAVVMAMFRAWTGAFQLGWLPADKIASAINTLWTETTTLPIFATAAFFEVNELTGKIRSIHCGHPPGLIVSASGAIREIRHQSVLPLGIEPTMETTIVEDTLSPGDTLVLYTDGITEARNPAGDLFGVDRLIEALRQVGQTPNLHSAADSLLEHVTRFSAGLPQSDDQCLVLARIGR